MEVSLPIQAQKVAEVAVPTQDEDDEPAIDYFADMVPNLSAAKPLVPVELALNLPSSNLLAMSDADTATGNGWSNDDDDDDMPALTSAALEFHTGSTAPNAIMDDSNTAKLASNADGWGDDDFDIDN